MTPRVDRLTEPPVVGRYYLVPCIRAVWFHMVQNWPVLGAIHADTEFFDFPHMHYHVDVRFLRVRDVQYLKVWFDRDVATALSAPIHHQLGPPERPVLRRRRCARVQPPYPYGHHPMVVALRAHYSGTRCARGKGGWICPHRKAALGSIAPDPDGLITCPLHGLRIDPETGIAP